MLIGNIILVIGLFLLGYCGAKAVLDKRKELEERYRVSVEAGLGVLAVSITPEDLFKASIGGCVAGAAVGALLAVTAGLLGIVFFGTLCGILGFFLPKLIVRYAAYRRKQAFLRQLPDALDMMCKAMATGRATQQAMQLIAEEMPSPISEEFRLTLRIQQHVGQQQGIVVLSERMNTPETSMLVMVIQFTARRGGNPVEPLKNLAATLRNRFNTEKKVKMLTSQVRLEAIITALLPVFVFIAFSFIVPEMMTLFLGHIIGAIVIGMIIILEALGAYWMWKIAQIRY